MLRAIWEHAGTPASLIGVLWFFRPPTGFTPIQWSFIGIIALSTVYFIRISFIRLSRDKLIKYGSSETAKIHEYMHDWIMTDGQVKVWSHDLTWVQARPDTKQLLMQKAQKHELTLYLPRPTPLAHELQSNGAIIYTYEQLEYIPRSRFTIIRARNAGSRVTIGHGGPGNTWVMEEFDSGPDCAYHLAEDLTEIVERVANLR